MTNNERRIMRACDIISHYRSTTYSGPEVNATVVIDVLADLLHWMESRGIDELKAIAQARDHFGAEIEEEAARPRGRKGKAK